MILCFSATGNCKYCAEYIASRTGDRVISLNDMMKSGVNFIDCTDSERLGIIAPTYDFDLAYAVSEFLERLEFRNVPANIYAFGIFTCGSGSGSTVSTFRKIMADKSINVNADFVVKMPDNYVLMFPQKSPEAIRQKLEQADKTLNELAEIIRAKKDSHTNAKKLPGIVTWLVKKFMVSSQRKVKGFTVNDKCIGCGRCARNCPMNIIAMKDNKPVWTKDNCACCLACLHRCPAQAINRGKSAKNGRYINPSVKF